jgi:hydroxyethylthiazole kinase-like sugar kinase family protein
MSRWVSLNQARAKASANWSGFSWKRREIGLVDRVEAQARSAVEHHGGALLARVIASGAMACSSRPIGRH